MNQNTHDTDGYKEILETEFFRNVDAGEYNTTAKKNAKTVAAKAYPEINRLMTRSMSLPPEHPEYIISRQIVASMMGIWKRLYEEADKRRGKSPAAQPELVPNKPPTPPSTKGNHANGSEPPALPRGSIVHKLLDALTAMNPKPGDEIHIGDVNFWAGVLQCSPSAIANPIGGVGPYKAFGKAGYEMEQVQKQYNDYVVRVVKAPAPPPADNGAVVGLTPDELAKLRALLKKLD